MNYRHLLLFLATLPATGSFADDLTVDNLTINAAANFGTLYTGAAASPILSGSAFTVSVSQALQDVYVPVTIEGHHEDAYVTVEDYGWISSGYMQAQYSYQVVGQQWVADVLDAEGVIITPGYWENVYGDVYTGESWVDTSYQGVVGTHQELQPVWIDTYESTAIEQQYGVPKIQFTAARSDVNWAWQIPAAGGVKDIMLLWRGGLHLPNDDVNRRTILTSDSLTQEYVVPWTGAQARVDSSQVKADGVKAVVTTHHDTNPNGWSEEKTGRLNADALQLIHEEKNLTTITSVQTQIAADNASFGGVVQVAGDVRVQGVLRVLPAGDLSMEGFTSGPRP